MLGYSIDELLALKFRELVIAETSEFALPDMICHETGKSVVFNGQVVSKK